ncbi:MAG: hypothetical protein PHR10_03750 [Sphaerochaetaceae bacterium]|nr:hypothetical protein [Sphaerochaetaceae bacterium]
MKILSLSSGNRLDGEMSPIVKAQNRSLQQAGVEIGIYALLESQIRFGKAKIALNDVLSHLLDDNETKIEEVLAFWRFSVFRIWRYEEL